MRVFLLLLLILVCTLVSSGVAEAVYSIPLKRRHSVAEAVHNGVSEKIQRRYKGKFGDIVLQNFLSVLFYGPVFLGTPEKLYQVVFDTGSGTLWAPGSKTGVCLHKQCYNPGKSSTTKPDGRKFHIEYGNGPVKGVLVKDKLRLASFTTDQIFGEATDVSGLGKSYSKSDWDGILGMAWTSLAVDNVKPPFFALADKYKNLANQFAFYLPKNMNNEGELLLGGYYPYHCKGELVGERLVTQTHWTVYMASARIGDIVLSDEVKVIVDSGNSLIAAPRAVFWEIVKSTDADSDRGVNTVDCRKVSSLPKIELEIAGVKWVFAGEDYVINHNNERCVLGFEPLDEELLHGETWILGAVFMRHIYTVFDADNPSLWFAYAK